MEYERDADDWHLSRTDEADTEEEQEAMSNKKTKGTKGSYGGGKRGC